VDRPQRPPWYLRVVPTTALALVVLGLLVLLVPGVRDQVRLSTTRLPGDVVELYFPPRAADGVERACVRHGAHVRVGFVLVSHFERATRLGYRVAFDPDAAGVRTVRRTAGTLAQPGTAKSVAVRLAAPRSGGFTVTVSLLDRAQDIRVHCAAGQQGAGR